MFSQPRKTRRCAALSVRPSRLERTTRIFAALLLCVLGVAAAPRVAKAGGIKAPGSMAELILYGTGAVLGGGALVVGYIGPTVHFARAAQAEREPERAWGIAGSIASTASLLTLSLATEQRDFLSRPRAPLYHTLGILAGQFAAFSIATAVDPLHPARERYALSLLMGAPAFSTCYFLSDALRGHLLMRKPAAVALFLGSTQVVGSSVWLARSSEEHKGLLMGTAAWGTVMSGYGLTSLLMQRQAHAQHFTVPYPYASLGRERTLGVTLRGTF